MTRPWWLGKRLTFAVLCCCTIALAASAGQVDLCKRQPFRGRCPSIKGKIQARSQFVLRYYLRDNECVSYPFGHCADDEDEPKLFRYKEECEKACMHERTTANKTAESNKGSSSTSTRKSTITEGSTAEQTSATLQASQTASVGDASAPQQTTLPSPKNDSIAQNPATECERRRHLNKSGLAKGGFFPICSADGSFRALQCEPRGEPCFCVDRNGTEIPHSRFSGSRKPDCSRIIIESARKPSSYECVVPRDPGPCSAALTRWYYDQQQRQCIQFQYSGCGGNGNNYVSKAACEKRCMPPSTPAPAVGTVTKCKGGVEPLKTPNGAPINCARSVCPSGYLCTVIQLSSVCCPNNETDAHRSNVETNPCLLPKERGPCDHYELRFYYNSRLGECKYFFFGGCEGNANNFERVEECERTCRQHGAKAAAATVVSAPQLITQGPQLKKINKEFATKSIKKTGEDNKAEQSIDNASTAGGTSFGSSSSTGSTVGSNTGSSATDMTSVEQMVTSLGTSQESTVAKDDQTTVGTTVNDRGRSTLETSERGKTAKGSLISGTSSTERTSATSGELDTAAVPSESELFVGSGDAFRGAEQQSQRSLPATQLPKSGQQVKTSSTARTGTTADLSETRSRAEGRTSPLTAASSMSSTTSAAIITTTAQRSTSNTSAGVPQHPPSQGTTEERCLQKRDRGTCAGQFIRWHWDAERRTCQVFTYSGCGGNGNNFASREECFAVCHRPVPQSVPDVGNVCEHSIDPGDCTGVFQRFAFDASTGDCRPFTYSGCGGNGNNFGSALDCRNKCVRQRAVLPADVCQHPIEVGECSGVFPRFAYDALTNECRPFTYGGCGGNGNNFGSMTECRSLCIWGQPVSSLPHCPPVNTSQCIEPCVLFSNRRGCQECVCPVTEKKSSAEAADNSQSDGTVATSEAHPPAPDSPPGVRGPPGAEQEPRNAAESENGSPAPADRTAPVNSVTELGEKCAQPVDAGPCKNFIERWYFDVNFGLCQSFQYGGCAGNRNHFFSKHECEIHCARFLNGRAGRRRIAAYQSASRTRQHNNSMWSLRSSEALHEHSTDDELQHQNTITAPGSQTSGALFIDDEVARIRGLEYTGVEDTRIPGQGAESEGRRQEGIPGSPVSGPFQVSAGGSAPVNRPLSQNGAAFSNQQFVAHTVQNFAPNQQEQWQGGPYPPPGHKLAIWIAPGVTIPQRSVFRGGVQVPSREPTRLQDVHRHQQIVDKWQEAFSSIRSASINSEVAEWQITTSTSARPLLESSQKSYNIERWPSEKIGVQTANKSTEGVLLKAAPSSITTVVSSDSSKAFAATDLSNQEKQTTRRMNSSQQIHEHQQRVHLTQQLSHSRTQLSPQQTSQPLSQLKQLQEQRMQSLRQMPLQRTKLSKEVSWQGAQLSQQRNAMDITPVSGKVFDDSVAEQLFTDLASAQISRDGASADVNVTSYSVFGLNESVKEMSQKTNTSQFIEKSQVTQTSEGVPIPHHEMQRVLVTGQRRNHRKGQKSEKKATASLAGTADMGNHIKRINAVQEEMQIGRENAILVPGQTGREGMIPGKPILNTSSSKSESKIEVRGEVNTENELREMQNRLTGRFADGTTLRISGEERKGAFPAESKHTGTVVNVFESVLDTGPTPFSRDLVSGHHVRIINQGSVSELLSTSSSSYSRNETLRDRWQEVSNSTSNLSSDSQPANSSPGAQSTHLLHAGTPSLNHSVLHVQSTAFDISTAVPLSTATFSAGTSTSTADTVITVQARTAEPSNFSPILLSSELNTESEEYRIIDNIAVTVGPQSDHQSQLWSTTAGTIGPTVASFGGSDQPVLLSTIAPLVPVSVTLFGHTPSTYSSSPSSTMAAPGGTTVGAATSAAITVSTLSTTTTAPTPPALPLGPPIVGFMPAGPPGSARPPAPAQPLSPGSAVLKQRLQKVIEFSEQNRLLLDQQNITLSRFRVGNIAPAAITVDFTGGSPLTSASVGTLTTTSAPAGIAMGSSSTQTSVQRVTEAGLTARRNILVTKSEISIAQSSEEPEEIYEFNADSSIFMNMSSDWSGSSWTRHGSSLTSNLITSQMSEPTTAQPRRTEGNSDEGEKSLPGTVSRVRGFTTASTGGMSPESMKEVARQFVSTMRTTVPASSRNSFKPTPSTVQHVEPVIGREGSQHGAALAQQQLNAAHNALGASKQEEIRAELRSLSSVRSEDVRLVHKAITEGPNQAEIFGPPVTPAVGPPAARVAATLQQLQSEVDDTCVLPPDAGTCFEYVPRWFYNSQTGKCEQFSYGSCGGNSNNFLERQACETKCAQGDSIRMQLPEQCTFEKDEGHGGGYNVKWYFNMRNLRCEQMVYQGQGGNANQFQTLGECQTFCTAVADKSPRAGGTTASKKVVQSSTVSALLQQHGKAVGASHLASQQQWHQGTLLEREHQRQQVVGLAGVRSAQGVTQYRATGAADSSAGGTAEVQRSGPEQYSATSSLSVQPPVLVTPAQQPSYNADPLEQVSHAPPSEVVVEQKPLAPSAPMEINYQNGSRAAASGTKLLAVPASEGSAASDITSGGAAAPLLSNSIEDVSRVPNCPNGLKPMQYLDGRPVMCLPGQNQCPENSVCYFNGVDFYCCPDPEDPYDMHVFGGYGGEEVKHGYKNAKKASVSINELNVRRKRLRRQVPPAFSVDQVARPARLDSAISHFSLAKASSDVDISAVAAGHLAEACLQDIDTGKCTEAHLRYFYDRRADACRLFYYSGCGGNQNNFATEAECKELCKSDAAAAWSADRAPPGSCPFGEQPLGDNAPVLCGNENESFECPKGFYCRMGPPHVCCPQTAPPDLEKILSMKKNSKDVRFAPHISGADSPGNQDHGELRHDGSKGSTSSNSLLGVPPNICPDGSDALLDESTREPLRCGAGFDGQQLCPVGYYCSIDSDRNGRLCCPLGVSGIKIPPPPNVPPFFGLRPSNPGEVIPRGSLPSDSIPLLNEKNESLLHGDGSGERYPPRLALADTRLATDVEPVTDFSISDEDEQTESSERLVPALHRSDSNSQDNGPYGRMMLKAKGKDSRTQAFYSALGNAVASESEADGVQIDIGDVADPFEIQEYAQKTTPDRSICHLKPTEGRACREDEPPPRTNLQYFYSRRDKRCKLYFYRGCGGNQNRFDTKRHCELTCSGL